MDVMVRGRWWSLTFAKLGGWWGDCNKRERAIRIDDRAAGFQLVDTVIHEMLHAEFPKATEKQVSEAATDITSALSALKLI